MSLSLQWLSYASRGSRDGPRPLLGNAPSGRPSDPFLAVDPLFVTRRRNNVRLVQPRTVALRTPINASKQLRSISTRVLARPYCALDAQRKVTKVKGHGPPDSSHV